MLAAPAPTHGDGQVLEPAAGHPGGVNQAAQQYRRRPLLVVMPDRDAALRAQGVQDAETLGLGDVLQVEAAEAGLKDFYCFDELVGVLWCPA